MQQNQRGAPGLLLRGRNLEERRALLRTAEEPPEDHRLQEETAQKETSTLTLAAHISLRRMIALRLLACVYTLAGEPAAGFSPVTFATRNSQEEKAAATEASF